MDYDRPSRHPRLVLDESIDFSSLYILIRHGLDQRCSGVYQSWCGEKRHNVELMKQYQRTTITAGRGEMVKTMVRIKKGIVRWLAGQAVTRYPCVCGLRNRAKIDGLAVDP